ncbi:hypothetical protein EIN_310060 [Entamoeba invadens IP1]|uniref:Uncharacterized protein n=1 Tax=Entamoeba invadens IP1 TaxID=370355 RepID=A0A0A1U1R4_ENTIV|nr:hypothetical protein EIN_310060 [Entamoeba invadens IP1]ELP84973.1 hypothetical protein EIN_310060 [Entamoeba invadens IP1]|eukprot:XP_004184319.1 hypothetical protein EIN_310060 [Entamoeba invadens IP1]
MKGVEPHMITISLSIHYVTVFGERIVVNFDNSTTKKLRWDAGHVWKITMTVLPRTMRWWYSVIKDEEVTRVEELDFPREYDFDYNEKYFQIVDHWGSSINSVVPIPLSKTEPFCLAGSPLIKNYLVPFYQASLERRKTPMLEEKCERQNTRVVAEYFGMNWGYYDDFALLESKPCRIPTVYSILREGLCE